MPHEHNRELPHPRLAGRRLSEALRAVSDAGGRAPCQNSTYGDLWFSDRLEERLRAAALCRGCPVQQLCRDYRDALDAAPQSYGATFHDPRRSPGVWGGRDYTPTPSARRQAS